MEENMKVLLNTEANDENIDFDELAEKCEYCVLVVEKSSQQVVHMVLYEYEPKNDDIISLREELTNDDSLGCTRYLSDELSYKCIYKHDDAYCKEYDI